MVRDIPAAGLLVGRVTIVTGAGTGIGRAIARVFHREGAKVVAADFSGEQNSVAKELGESVLPMQVDVRREKQIETMFATATDAFGRIDGVVNNAGVVYSRQPDFSVGNYEDYTQTNLLGLMLVCKHALRVMAAGGGGSIVNVSSVASLATEERTALAYAAAKAGVNSLTKTLAVRHAQEGIRVNAILPGFTHSETNTRIPLAMIAHMAAKSPMGRGADPEEQAQVAAFLISDRSSYLSGAIIPVDGAWSARLI